MGIIFMIGVRLRLQNFWNAMWLVVCFNLAWQAVSSMNVYSWVQGGHGTNLDKTFFSSSLAKSKVTTSGPRMIPREQWLV